MYVGCFIILKIINFQLLIDTVYKYNKSKKEHSYDYTFQTQKGNLNIQGR